MTETAPTSRGVGRFSTTRTYLVDFELHRSYLKSYTMASHEAFHSLRR